MKFARCESQGVTADGVLGEGGLLRPLGPCGDIDDLMSPWTVFGRRVAGRKVRAARW